MNVVVRSKRKRALIETSLLVVALVGAHFLHQRNPELLRWIHLAFLSLLGLGTSAIVAWLCWGMCPWRHPTKDAPACRINPKTYAELKRLSRVVLLGVLVLLGPRELGQYDSVLSRWVTNAIPVAMLMSALGLAAWARLERGRRRRCPDDQVE